MLDSGKLKPPTVIVPFDDGEPPPDDPHALTMRLSPRIEDRRARNAHRFIGFLLICCQPLGPAMLRSGSNRLAVERLQTSVRVKVYQVAGFACGAPTATAPRVARPAAERRPVGVSSLCS